MQYGKQEFYAKVEPDNYASQFLIERLKGKPVGLAKDFQISDERVKQFVESRRYLLDGRIKNIAKVFEVEEDLLLTNLLVYNMLSIIIIALQPMPRNRYSGINSISISGIFTEISLTAHSPQ